MSTNGPIPDYEPTFLEVLIESPRKVIFGAILTTLIEGVTGVFSAILSGVTTLLAGTEPATFNGADEQLGLADLPVAIADTLLSAGAIAGGGILTAIDTINQPLYDLAGSAGPASPIIVAAVVVVEIIVAVLIVERVVYIVLDLLQLGGLSE